MGINYNGRVIGHHLIVDVKIKNSYQPMFKFNNAYNFWKNLLAYFEQKVVDDVKYKWDDYAYLIVFALEESHFSIHTYPEIGYYTLDLYTCKIDTDIDEFLRAVEEYFVNGEIKNINVIKLERGKANIFGG